MVFFANQSTLNKSEIFFPLLKYVVGGIECYLSSDSFFLSFIWVFCSNNYNLND